MTLDSATILTPSMTWENRVGAVRQYAYAKTEQPFTPTSLGIDVYGSTNFPSIEIQDSDRTTNRSLTPSQLKNVVVRAGAWHLLRPRRILHLLLAAGRQRIQRTVRRYFGPAVCAAGSHDAQRHYLRAVSGNSAPGAHYQHSALNSLLPTAADISTGKTPYSIGAYAQNNKLPYTENWTFDMQWQPFNSLQMSLGYVAITAYTRCCRFRSTSPASPPRPTPSTARPILTASTFCLPRL